MALAELGTCPSVPILVCPDTTTRAHPPLADEYWSTSSLFFRSTKVGINAVGGVS